MRLKKKDTQAILRALQEFEPLKEGFELYLFGSRADHRKLGGDIDLLLVVSQSIIDKIMSGKHLLISQTKKYLDDQRIDITVRAKETLSKDPFYLSIQGQLIRLS